MSMAELTSAAPTSGGVSNVRDQLRAENKVLNLRNTLSRDRSFIFGRTLTLPQSGEISSPGSLAVS